MASVVKREKSKFWTACYTSRDGRQLKRSTKSIDKNQAMGIAVEFERLERQNHNHANGRSSAERRRQGRLWAGFRLPDKRYQKHGQEQDGFCRKPSVHAGDQESLRGNLVLIRARF